MPADYVVLAPVYDALGMGDFANTMTPRLVDYAQRNDWMGRRVLDLGSGTSTNAEFLHRIGYMLTCVDDSAEMLQNAQDNAKRAGINARWVQQDIRKLNGVETVDLVLALDVLNELNTLQELGTVFEHVRKVLAPNKLLIFDLRTIEGLTQEGTIGDKLIKDDKTRLFVTQQNAYDHERQMHTRALSIFRAQDGVWHRFNARQVLRAYPLQAVVTMLQRSGFNPVRVLTLGLEPYDLNHGHGARVIFYAQRANTD
jgi:SAM-dependent methyltransferase